MTEQQVKIQRTKKEYGNYLYEKMLKSYMQQCGECKTSHLSNEECAEYFNQRIKSKYHIPIRRKNES